MRKLVLGALAIVGLVSVPAANADYIQGFDGLTGSAAGVNLNNPSQDGWFQPVVGGVDYFVYNYIGNAPGFGANPTGGTKFIAGQGPGGTVFARTQRVINDFGDGSQAACLCYDFAVKYNGPTPESAQNVGSVSVRDAGAAVDLIHLFTWVDPLTPTTFNAWYLVYDAGGIQTAQPGLSPGTAWDNLAVDNWYRSCITFDTPSNTFTQVSIDDLEDANPVATFVDVSALGWYMDGGSVPPGTIPSQLRFFAGGSVDGNVVAGDNVSVTAGVCPGPPTPTVNESWGSLKDQFKN
jgi:hypothetical protein